MSELAADSYYGYDCRPPAAASASRSTNPYGPDPKGRISLRFLGHATAEPAVAPADQEIRLRQLKACMDEGLISESEYAEKRAQILSEI